MGRSQRRDGERPQRGPRRRSEHSGSGEQRQRPVGERKLAVEHKFDTGESSSHSGGPQPARMGHRQQCASGGVPGSSGAGGPRLASATGLHELGASEQQRQRDAGQPVVAPARRFRQELRQVRIDG